MLPLLQGIKQPAFLQWQHHKQLHHTPELWCTVDCFGFLLLDVQWCSAHSCWRRGSFSPETQSFSPKDTKVLFKSLVLHSLDMKWRLNHEQKQTDQVIFQNNNCFSWINNHFIEYVHNIYYNLVSTLFFLSHMKLSLCSTGAQKWCGFCL